jgi:capsular exopolysaccharide synthesis family protein
MGRVDDALQRAAEQRPGTAERAAVVDRHVDDAADEPFPIEMPSRRRLKTTGPAASAVVESAPAADAVAEPAVAGSTVPAFAALLDQVTTEMSHKVVIDSHMAPQAREQYRRLAAALHRAQEQGLKTVMIASAVASEGKTLTAANLALTLSESYKRNVLLIDADFRRPSLHKVFNIKGTPGLMEGLLGAEMRLSLQQVSQRLAILPAGTPTSDPMAALTSPGMKRVIDEARAMYDWVIVDTPPIGLLADANLLAAMLDGTLLVVRAGSTPFSIIKWTADTIGADHLLGVVLNGATQHAAKYGYNYKYHSYTHYQAGPEAGA